MFCLLDFEINRLMQWQFYIISYMPFALISTFSSWIGLPNDRLGRVEKLQSLSGCKELPVSLIL